MAKQIILLLLTLLPLGLAAQESGDLIAPPAQGAAQRLSALPGFKVSVFASRLDNPRGMALSPDGVLYVCDMKDGCVLALEDPDGKGYCSRPQTVIQGLDHPHSLVFWGGELYVGETTRISRFTLSEGLLGASDGHTVIALPPGGRHFTRTLDFGPDGKLYVSIGSTCDACEEKDERYGTICRLNTNGTAFEIYARGLRNAVGIRFRPGTSQLWASGNGRDYLGDDLPPEGFYLVEPAKHYGWPYSYSLNGKTVPDPDLGKKGIRQTGQPVFEYQAHTAPLGINFYTGQAFPAKFKEGLFVCFHGSWNRSIPVGYKVVFFPLAKNKLSGKPVDFLWGFLQGPERVGRPVDVINGARGELFVSDDYAGRIFKVVYSGS
jgi:glucose/arabinose dehydrogenase